MRYKIFFTQTAENDYYKFKKSGQTAITNKIKSLLNDIAEHPYTGIGKPEPLKYNLSGAYSRRITQEHRLVYDVHEDTQEIEVLSMSGHY